MTQMKKKLKGYTLIELMLVVIILGILSIVAVQKYVDLSTKAKEASTKGDLGILRSCVGIYYGQHETLYPESLTDGCVPENMAQLPSATLNGHPDRNGEITDTDDSDGTAGWVYPDSSSNDHGKVWVNCTHTDIEGIVISSW